MSTPRLSRALARLFGLGLGLGAALLLLPLARARAADPPHWTSASFTIDCTSQCHTLHQSPGGQLTAAAGNVNLCQYCHNAAGLASDLAINNGDKAVPGTQGTSHAFDVPAVNANFGTVVPAHAQMGLRVMNGNVVCSTCHDQHAADSARGGTPRISRAKKLTALGSTGIATSAGAFSGTTGYWYLVEIQAAGAFGTARFRWSKDNGTSWMAQNVVTAASNALDNGVSVAFSTGNYSVGERWEFSASWPFLRAKLDSGDNASADKFCRDCHSGWAMDSAAVRTWTGAAKSHPVGIALPVADAAYRTVPLDGNWEPQGGAGADTNPTNDLKLDSGGRVQCLSCHGAHRADSNTQTVDTP